MKPQELAALEKTLALSLQDVTGPAASKALYDTWNEAHQKILGGGRAREAVDPGFVVAADQSRAKPPQQAEGIIVSLYDYRREAVRFAMKALEAASPRRSGAYVRGHTVFVNRQAVGRDCPPIQESDDVFIANVLPYARRLEIGKTTSGRDFVVQVPNRIYERVAKGPLRQRYKNVIDPKFAYVDLNDAYVVKGKLPARYLSGGRRQRKSKLGAAGTMKSRLRRQQVGAAIRYPAIIFRPL